MEPKKDKGINLAVLGVVLITGVFALILEFSYSATGNTVAKLEQDKLYVFNDPYSARVHKGYREVYTPCPPGTVSYSIESRSVTAAIDSGRNCWISSINPKKYCCGSVFYERFDDPLAKYLNK